jgi:hypothetical protein
MEKAATLLFHILVTTGVAIVATGASGLQSSNTKPADASKDISLEKAGISLLTLSWAITAIVSVWTLARPAKSPQPRSAAVAGTRVSLLHEFTRKYFSLLNQ